MKESSSNNKINLEFYKEQLRISSIPLITVYIPEQKNINEVDIIIENVGQLPAFEIDIWIFSAVHQDDVPKKELVKLSKGKVNKTILKNIDVDRLADGEFYSLFDRGVYAILPGKYRIKLNSKFAFDPYSIDLLLQYKDHVGNNYYQRYGLSHTLDNKKRLIIDDITPSSLQTYPRFKFEAFESKKEKLNIPKDVEYLYELMRSGIYLELLDIDKDTGVENKWELERII